MKTNRKTKTSIQQIHNEFYSASERLLAEAEEVIELSARNESKKGERLNRLGFSSCAQAQKHNQLFHKAEKMHKQLAAIDSLKLKFPGYKFITDDQVYALNKKYNLFQGSIDRFKGFVPEKNLNEIEAFLERAKKVMWGSELPSPFSLFARHIEKKDSDVSKFLSICAPPRDMVLDRYDRVDENGVIHDDPVVLFNCGPCFIIVTAWGDEASDEIIVNESNQ